MMRAAWVLTALFIATAAFAEPPVPDIPRKPVPQKTKPGAKAKPAVRPAWAELTAEQQQILAPLKADWESLEPERRRKWIGVAKRYPSMTKQAQERVQRRMQLWAKLTPEQRRQARETYKQIVKVPPEKRANLRQQWAEYQALSPQERETLVAPEDKKRR